MCAPCRSQGLCLHSFVSVDVFLAIFHPLSHHGLSSGMDGEEPARAVGSNSFQVTLNDAACFGVSLVYIFEVVDWSTCRLGNKGKLAV